MAKKTVKKSAPKKTVAKKAPVKAAPAKAAKKGGAKTAPVSNSNDPWASAEAKAEKAWQKSREHEPKAFSGVADIPNGSYIVQLTECIRKKGTAGSYKDKPLVEMKYVIQTGEHEGVPLRSTDILTDDPVGDTGLTQMDLFSERLQKIGVEGVADMEFSDIKDVVDTLNEEKPLLRVSVKTKDGKNGYTNQNVYITKQVDPADLEDDDTPDTGGDGEDGDDDEGAEVEVGSTVDHSEFGQCEVKKIATNGTLWLEDENGDVHKGVAADEVELME
jgi:hypothetical protein